MIENSGELIRKYRVAKGLSQKELSLQLGVSQAAVGQWERGIFTPRGRNINALCDVLGIPVGLLSEALPVAFSANHDLEDHVEMRPASEQAEKIKTAEHQAQKTDFQNRIFSLLSSMSIDMRKHVAVEGPLKNQFIVDCLTHRSVVELKFPRSYAAMEQMMVQTLWRLTVLRGFMKGEKNYVAIVRRPRNEGDSQAMQEYENRFSALLAEAFLVGIRLHLVDTAEEAAKAIEDAELESQ